METTQISEDAVMDGTVDIHGNPADKNKTGNWKACLFILGSEFFESLANCGMSTNLVNYFVDRLNEGNATASTNINNWSGTCYILPLLGAFIADAYWGKFRTTAVFSVLYLVGMVLFTLSASVNGLKPLCSADGCHPTPPQIAVAFFSLYLVALGFGATEPCFTSFGADQFDETDDKERNKKSSFFNWLYFTSNVGALLGSSLLVWVQNNVNWGWGFGIPTIAMAISVVLFFCGFRLYRFQKPGGSPLTRISQVLVATFRKIKIKVPEEKSRLYETADAESSIKGSRKLEYTHELRCFDKAAVPIDSDDMRGTPNPWRLCTVTQVEEFKAVVRLLPILATGIVFSAIYSQMSTMFVLQGNTLDQHIGPNFKIPSASLLTFDILSVMFWVPVYDLMIIPVFSRLTGRERGFSQLQRMGVGLVISIFSMVTAGILEVVRLNMVREHNYYDLKTVPLSIFWQIPQYFLVGCAEVFICIGQLEFFYDQAPDAMRSLCSALSLTAMALGNYLSSLLVTIVTDVSTRDGKLGWIPDNLNRGHLDYFFWLLTVLSVANFLAYLWIAKWYTYKKVVGAGQLI